MSLLDNARAIEAALQRLQGPPATGKLLVKAKLPDGSPGPAVQLWPGSIAAPIVGGAIERRGSVYVRPNPAGTDEDTAKRPWTVTAAGTLVDVECVQGGIQGNQDGGTSYRWDPPLPGIEDVSEADATGLTGGDFTGAFAGLRQFAHLKSVTFDPNLNLFEGAVFDYPAVVLAWVSTEPLDGSYSAQPGPRTARTSSGGRMLYKNAWALYLITSRFDGAEARAQEGATLLDDVLDVLTDCKRVRDRCFAVSAEPGAQITSARPLYVGANVYADVVMLETRFLLERRPEERAYHDWLRTRLRQQTAAQPPDPPIDIPNIIIPMPPNGPGTPPFP